MEKSLSVKNYVLVLMDQSRFFLSKSEAELIERELEKGTKYLKIGDNFIASSVVMKIVSGINYQETEKIKKGDYKCGSCGQWIPKGYSCGYCRV